LSAESSTDFSAEPTADFSAEHSADFFVKPSTDFSAEPSAGLSAGLFRFFFLITQTSQLKNLKTLDKISQEPGLKA
jgi:hypothetical protein